jgi:hypothetical protein
VALVGPVIGIPGKVDAAVRVTELGRALLAGLTLLPTPRSARDARLTRSDPEEGAWRGSPARSQS